MKKIIVILTLISVAVGNLFSQEIKPKWAEKTINPPMGANYIFVIGRGEGKDRVEAKRQAEYNAIKSSAFELGAYGISSQDLQDIETKGLDMVISSQRMPRRWITEQFIENKVKERNEEKTVFVCYIAYAVKRDINGKDDLYDIDLSQFEDKTFAKKSEKASLKKEDNFYTKGRDKYLVFVLGDMSLYPLLGANFSIYGRHSGKIGIGYEFSVGFNTNFYVGTLSYMGKIRFYCYKSLFIQAGFGVMGVGSIGNNSQIYDDYWHGRAGDEQFVATNYIMYGIPMQLGCDVLLGKLMTMSFRGGVGYDIVMKKIVPQINISLVGFKVKL